MDSVKVEIDVENNLISVYNNGAGVPVEIHKEEGVYVPEMIFGQLLTSSNYDDNVKKTTGGRNGYGAKLTNIFSTEFVIETADGRRQKKYKQVFSNNMVKKSEPIITKCQKGENWTKVTFKPDLAKFGMTYLEEHVVALMKKRVVDLAGCLGHTVNVELNGVRVPVTSFQEYCNLYLNPASDSSPDQPKSFYEKADARWEICVAVTEGKFQQVSFVNGIATIKGGTHVDYITKQITDYVLYEMWDKHKYENITAHNVKNHLWVFINCLIDNPAFDSQTKETLTLRSTDFGSTCYLSDVFLAKVAETEIDDFLLSWAKYKKEKEMKKTDGTKTKKVNVPKLDNANEAGGKYSDKCTLILTEGDSAKALASAGVAGLPEIERNFYGVFPLRGKLLNVREATERQVNDNKEIQHIKKILGLQHEKQYDDVKPLRYGHLMIMTDQDHDGSHIKGLLINFIHSLWPSLLKISSFLVEFVTPIVKATHTNGRVLSFYSMPEYEIWKDGLQGNASGWSIKYYKGLGTSKSDEGKEYFQNLDKHKKDFVWETEQDGDAIELAFSKTKIEARKSWLRNYKPGTHLDQNEKLIKYSDFVNKELILFSLADLQRSIPSMVDGLKPGQRKILFCSFKRNFVKEAKVAQFSGYVSEHSAYHHGEQSLASTIIGMAQDYVGSNNINLLQPNGQFGTRNMGGKDHASARYIYTQLSPITRFLFHKDDDHLLNYLDEDGQSIEPTWNWHRVEHFHTNYNPRDIVTNVRRLLDGRTMEPMHPWYRGFKGTIEKDTTKEASYIVNGVIYKINETKVRITELPVRKWTDDYKAYLESITDGARDAITGNLVKNPFIKELRKYSDDATVNFELILSEKNMSIAKRQGLLNKFKLTSTISTSNMHLFDSAGVIKKYDTPEQILEEFFHLRLEYYVKRKKVLLENVEFELLKLQNKVRFILGVVRGEIVVNNRKKADLVLELHQKGFTPIPKKSRAVVAGATDGKDEVEGNSGIYIANGLLASDYDYLLSMAIGTLTLEKVQQLCDESEKLNVEVENLRKATPKALWVKDLEALEMQLDALDKCDAEAEEARQNLKCCSNAETGSKVSRQTPKIPRKYTKETKNDKLAAETIGTPSSSATKTESTPEVEKPKEVACSGNAPAKTDDPAPVSKDIVLDVVESLKDLLKENNLDSSPEHSAEMEADELQLPSSEKEPSNADATQKKPEAIVVEISDDELDNPYDDSDIEIIAASEVKSNGRRNAAAKCKATKMTAATKRRGPAASKQSQGLGRALLTEKSKPAENLVSSPQKKVRKIRASPFNKKSRSVLGRLHRETSVNTQVIGRTTSEGSVTTTGRTIPLKLF